MLHRVINLFGLSGVPNEPLVLRIEFTELYRICEDTIQLSELQKDVLDVGFDALFRNDGDLNRRVG